jgi:hypothetical protein
VSTELSYSPRLRTGVVLCGTGTAGAYQAGALQALVEAGVKIDVLAAHGTGAMTALSAAIDGGSRLWDPAGPWTDPRLRRAYRWRAALRFGIVGIMAMVLLLLTPLLVVIVAGLAYGLSLIAALVNLERVSAAMMATYRQMFEFLFSPPVLPTILPRAIVFALLIVAGVLVAAAVQAARHERSRRRFRGAFWWRLVGTPLDGDEPAATLIEALWKLVRGASSAPRPSAAEIGRRYVDVLTDNFGQPGFHEVIIGVHDLDARRDLVGAVLPAQARAAFEMRREGAGAREAETIDFTGPQRELIVEFLAGALRLPIATPPRLVEFPADSYWRGERHRLCDRPELVSRLVDELAAIGVEQVILVSPAAPPATPHSMRARPADLRGRIGEMLRSVETAALQDAARAATARFSGVFVIRPDHNPIGPFDFAGAYDEASDRQRTVGELIQQGYADAYRHFIEPVVATGERIEAI